MGRYTLTLGTILAIACSGSDQRAPTDRPGDPDPGDPGVGSTGGDIAPGDTLNGDSAWPDPFDIQAPTTHGLVNVSDNLEELLEFGALADACDAWLADRDDQRKRLLCGKAMFFYESFDTFGVPTPVYEFLGSRFPDEIGIGFRKYGLIPDPYSDTGRNLGCGDGKAMDSGVETVALVCASCHFGQLPDGRYAVGAANHDYDYGKHMLSVMLLPAAVDPAFNPDDHHPDAMAAIAGPLATLQGDPLLGAAFGVSLVPLLAEEVPDLSVEYEGHYASWRTGTMDFVMPPVPIDDEVHSVTKIIDLWDLPHPNDHSAWGMTHAMLGWTGGSTSLMSFLRGFVSYGGSTTADWPDDRIAPLRDYILSLRSPPNPNPPQATYVDEGRDLFRSRGCIDCHQGPGGSGLRWYTFEEVGTDAALMHWGDPDGDGRACCGLTDADDEDLTQGVKSPRLTGLWSKTRILHNGALDNLEQLLCLEDRPEGEVPFSSAGHTFGCDLPNHERYSLIQYLLAQ